MHTVRVIILFYSSFLTRRFSFSGNCIEFFHYCWDQSELLQPRGGGKQCNFNFLLVSAWPESTPQIQPTRCFGVFLLDPVPNPTRLTSSHHPTPPHPIPTPSQHVSAPCIAHPLAILEPPRAPARGRAGVGVGVGGADGMGREGREPAAVTKSGRQLPRSRHTRAGHLMKSGTSLAPSPAERRVPFKSPPGCVYIYRI